MSLETFVSTNPPAVFVAGPPTGTLFDQWETNALAHQVGAIKDHKVYRVNQTVWSRWRGLTAAELIAQDVVTTLNGS